MKEEMNNEKPNNLLVNDIINVHGLKRLLLWYEITWSGANDDIITRLEKFFS